MAGPAVNFPHRALAVLLALCFPLTLAGAEDKGIRISALPDPVYFERSASALLVNCDFLIENQTNANLTLRAVEASVYDAQGKLVLRKFVNDNGNSPSIALVNQRDVPAQGRVLVFNPLFNFPPDLDISRLHYEFALIAEGGHETLTSLDVEPRGYTSSAPLYLPLRGRLLVWDGHDFYAHHRRFNYLTPGAQASGTNSNPDRYGYDFVLVDETGAMYQSRPGMETKKEDWFGYGQPIHAAGAGRVVIVSDDAPDNGQVDEERFAQNKLADYGNYVLIQQAEGEYALYGHLRQGSAQVRVDDHVERGQVIAAIGFSGSSLMPHLHFQLQTTADTDGEGLPSYFDSYVRLLGSQSMPVAHGQIDSGDFVQHSLPVATGDDSPATRQE